MMGYFRRPWVVAILDGFVVLLLTVAPEPVMALDDFAVKLILDI